MQAAQFITCKACKFCQSGFHEETVYVPVAIILNVIHPSSLQSEQDRQVSEHRNQN